MQKRHPLVSIYDAHSEKEIFGNPNIFSFVSEISLSLVKAKLGTIGTVSSPVVITILSKINELGVYAIGLSPAGNHREHEKAFRLPNVSFPVVFTGRGVLGTDLMALESSHGVLIVGSDEESLLGILGFVGNKGVPIGIFTEENSNEVRRKISSKYPNLMQHVFVSKDSNILAKEISSEMRRQQLKN